MVAHKFVQELVTWKAMAVNSSRIEKVEIPSPVYVTMFPITYSPIEASRADARISPAPFSQLKSRQFFPLRTLDALS